MNSPKAELADLPDDLEATIKTAVLGIATKDKAAFDKATDGKAKPWEPVDNKAYDAIIELNRSELGNRAFTRWSPRDSMAVRE